MRTDPLAEMAKRRATLSLVVHSPSKRGKTTLSSTCPKPLLLLDAEGGTKFLPNPQVLWDPMAGPPPEPDGTWEICVVPVSRWETMTQVYQWLALGQHPFASLCVDSLTEVQRRCKANIQGAADMQLQLWGKLLDSMLGVVRDMRDLTEHPTNPLSVVMFISETKMVNGMWRPYMQGQLQDTLPYTVDVLGWLDVVQLTPDPSNPLHTVPQRQLRVVADFEHEAGERVQGRLGEVVVDPRVDVMLSMVYPQFYQQASA